MFREGGREDEFGASVGLIRAQVETREVWVLFGGRRGDGELTAVNTTTSFGLGCACGWSRVSWNSSCGWDGVIKG